MEKSRKIHHFSREKIIDFRIARTMLGTQCNAQTMQLVSVIRVVTAVEWIYTSTRNAL